MNFIRALGLRDVVLMNIVAVVGMRWIARGARTGPPSVTFFRPSCCAARVPFAAGVDSAMPRSFARLHPRYRTPYVALIVQSVAASAISWRASSSPWRAGRRRSRRPTTSWST